MVWHYGFKTDFELLTYLQGDYPAQECPFSYACVFAKTTLFHTGYVVSLSEQLLYYFVSENINKIQLPLKNINKNIWLRLVSYRHRIQSNSVMDNWVQTGQKFSETMEKSSTFSPQYAASPKLKQKHMLTIFAIQSVIFFLSCFVNQQLRKLCYNYCKAGNLAIFVKAYCLDFKFLNP